MRMTVRGVRRWLAIGSVFVLALLEATAYAAPPAQAAQLQLVASFYGPLPLGVAVSQSGRIFVSFPHWFDQVDYTVGEVTGVSTSAAYPNTAINRFNPANALGTLVSVQGLVVDGKDRLWLLDSGSINFAPPYGGGPKLVGVNLQTNKVFKTILIPPEVATPMSYLNDLRVDARVGQDGVAYITDSSDQMMNGIIVVDVGTGASWRRLNRHPTTQAERGFLPNVEGQPLLVRAPILPPMNISTGADGIAISPDGARLFYHPLASRRLYSVSADALRDRALSDDAVANTIINHGEVGVSDGMVTDAKGRVYTTNAEHNALYRHPLDGTAELVVQDSQLLWPDSLDISADGYLYVTANQLNRAARYHEGVDLRQRPFNLFRVKLDAGPVVLR